MADTIRFGERLILIVLIAICVGLLLPHFTIMGRSLAIVTCVAAGVLYMHSQKDEIRTGEPYRLADSLRFTERLVLVVLSGWAVMRFLPSFTLHPQAMLVLATEIVSVFFILTQRKGTWSTDPYATTIAFLGSAAPLCIINEGKQALIPEYISMMLVLGGSSIVLFAKLSLRRSFGLIPANRGVKRGGAYRFVRHPMYTGYVINHIGLLLVFPSIWNICVYLVCWTLLSLRIVEEEKFLRQDPEYVRYAEKVRSRIIPGLI